MKKVFALMLALLLSMTLLAGCGGTPVVVAPDDGGDTVVDAGGEGALKTGLAIVANVSGSTAATAEESGAAKYDLTIAAVLVDEGGVIRAAALDSVGTTVNFDAAGKITSDLTAPVPTKNELGADYGMVAYGGAIAEWDAQAAALCDFAVGKTVEEFKNGAVDASGKAPAGSDLASSATIYLGGYVSAIESAAANATHLGAQSGDTLALSVVNSLGKSADATAEKDGNVQLYTTVAAVSHVDGVITACLFDAVQANVGFTTAGALTTDLTAPILTKNQLGENYGMVAYGGAIAEWDAQAAAFADYIVGKTAAEVTGIAVNETTAPTDADLTASVTIKIGDFQTLITKAMG